MSHSTSEPVNPYARPQEAILEPPVGFWRTLRFLGPSFILIGSIVGSGELILTTSLGAKLGFAGLWFITLSCVVKTIIQAELGRYTITSGDTCLEAFNRLPGPRKRVGWFVWLWMLWQIPGLITGGAILGSTGQVLSTGMPFLDQVQWAMLLAVVNVIILLAGRYRFLEKASTYMVISFSIITVLGAVALQFTRNAVPLEEALQGLQIQIGPLLQGTVVATVAAAFAGTGVSGGELMAYTYWCVEKGYARYAGDPDESEAWARRARGWVRVMQLDVWLATGIFTVTTIAFYWLGAGVLHRQGLQPEDSRMIATLTNLYTDSLGPWTAGLFLLGGFFVLYSTIFSGTAGTTRLYADALGVLKLVDFSDFQARLKWIRIFTVAVPAIQAIVFALNPKPHTMLTLGALANGMLAPVLAFGTIWLRRHGTDPRIAPSRLTDFFLWVCSGTVCAVSLGYVLLKLPELVGR